MLVAGSTNPIVPAATGHEPLFHRGLLVRLKVKAGRSRIHRASCPLYGAELQSCVFMAQYTRCAELLAGVTACIEYLWYRLGNTQTIC